MDFARIFRNSHADCMQILPCDQAIHIDFNIFELNHWLYCRTISKASDCLYDALFQRALCKCNTKQPFFCVTSMCQQYEAPWNAVCWNGELGEMHTQKKIQQLSNGDSISALHLYNSSDAACVQTSEDKKRSTTNNDDNNTPIPISHREKQ